MSKWEKLYDYVQNQEDKFYDLAIKEMEQGKMGANVMYMTKANAFQQIKYKMEDLDEEENKKCK